VFELLEGDKKWQQALCIRLFFEFGAPLARLMAARWSQILDGYWHPYRPGDRIFWFEGREQIKGDARAILERVKRLIQRDVKPSEYWFPSRAVHSPSHIKTVDATWWGTLHRLGFPPYPLREFALSYRNLNNPSYLATSLWQHRQTFREVQGVDDVSKTLMSQKNI
jgi:hypothetical protein